MEGEERKYFHDTFEKVNEKVKKGSVWKAKMTGYANGSVEKGCGKVALREIKEDKFSSRK